MEILGQFIGVFLHIDRYLADFVRAYGVWVYGILFLIVFAETGFVFTPFLPGDSLLFAAGAFAALGSLNLWVLLIVLFIAAVAGDSVNYWIGHVFGKKLSEKADGRFIKKEYIDKTEAFYQKYGKKTIILASFFSSIVFKIISFSLSIFG